MEKKQIYLLSFLLPLATLLVGMVYFEVAPFGDQSLVIIDGLHQYMPFYSVLYDKLRGGESLFYTFRTGLGVNFLSLFAYYLSSPFNLLILFFKRSDLNMVVSFLIVLKLALSGLSASIYFTRKSKQPGISVVVVSVAYALNGYMVGYSWNVMWLDAIMVLPLVILGIEKLIEEKNGKLYCLALFYALYCNYYIAFMICIFSVIWYLLYRFDSVKQFFWRGISFAGHSLLAAGMAAVLLLPAYYGIKQTASGNEMGLPQHFWQGNFWELLGRPFNLAYPITNDNFDGTGNLYFGIFSIMCLFLYALNREIRWTEKCKKIMLVLFFYLSFQEGILNFIWHGFHDQYGIPNRFAFLYGFVLLGIVFEVLEHREGNGFISIVCALGGPLAILGASYHFSEEKLPSEVLWTAVILLAVYTIGLLFYKMGRKRKLYYKNIVSLIMIGEIIVSSLLGFGSNGQIILSKFFSATEEMELATKEQEDGTFYRSELADTKMVDESTWYPMHAITLFGSTAKGGMVEMMNHLGFYTGCNEYLYKGSTPVTDMMFNMKYLYYHNTDGLKTTYSFVKDYGEMALYENPTEGMSIGYGIDREIDGWYYESDYPFRVLNDFAYSGYYLNGAFDTIRITEPYTKGCRVEETNDGEYRFDYREKHVDNLIFTIPVEQNSRCLYLFYDGTQVNQVNIAINGERTVSGDLDSRMIPVGAVEKGDCVTVSMELKGEVKTGYVRLSGAYFNKKRFDALANEMASRALHLQEWNDHHLEGVISLEKEQYLFLSIPYDSGWKVKIDGKNAETFAIGNAFLSVIIPEGTHSVVLDYVPEGFFQGVILSGLSVILFLCLVLFQKKIRNRTKKEQEMESDQFDLMQDVMMGGCEYEEIWMESSDSVLYGSDDGGDSDSTNGTS